MTDDHTRRDLGLFNPVPGAGGVITEDVDDILGAVIDGRYEVVSRLGQGGMGFVYEARDLALGGRDVVIKTLRPELVNNERTAERFSREAMMQARIDHVNVITVMAHGVTKDYGAYYVMERLMGQDLGALLKTLHHPLPVHRVLHIVEQVTSALAAAHENAIVHRDLKPENIFLTTGSDGQELVKVLDFGLARMLDAGHKLTETGAVIGTPRYMAPEQCHGLEADARADIYSLGLVMYEMLSAVQPYKVLNTYEILGKKMFEEVPRLSDMDPPVMLDPRLEAFVMRCLSKEPDGRVADGARLGEELQILKEQLKEPLPPRAGEVRAVHRTMHISDRPLVSGIKPPSALRASAPSFPASDAAPMAQTVLASTPPRRNLSVVMLAGVLFALAVLGALGVATLILFEPSATPPPAPAPVAVPDVAPVAVPAPTPPVAAAETIHVRTEPSGAEVRHGELVLGRTPLELSMPSDVAEGDTIELSLEGYVTRTIRISSGVPTAHVRLHESP